MTLIVLFFFSFIKQLLRKTPQTHPDYRCVENAISEIRKVLDYLNDDLKQEEAKRKVSEIAAAFDTSLDTLVLCSITLLVVAILLFHTSWNAERK
jgi:hypothetical protein